MKKLICILLIISFAVSLSACSGINGEEEIVIPSEKEQQSYVPAEGTPSGTGDKAASDGAFERIVVGYSGVDLPVPPYEENGVIYADLAGFASYFGATVSYNEEKTLAIVSLPDTGAKYQIITFEAGKTEVSAANLSGETTDTVTISAAPKVTAAGFDICAADFASMIGYTCEMNGGVLNIHE